MAQDDGDFCFISGCIVSILKAPTWVAPISNFIDEHCGIFDDQEENKLEYTSVHNAFCKLVDGLLTAHIAELSITVEQFTEFCRRGLTGENEVQRSLIEQLISVDDFLVFKAMMVKRSADLAHEIIIQPVPLAPPEANPYDQELPEAIKIEALRLEAERLEAERRCLEAELQLVAALALQLEQRIQLTKALTELEQAVARMEALSLAAVNDDAAQATTMEAPLSAPAELPPLQVRTSGGVPGAIPQTIRVAPLLQDAATIETPPAVADPLASRPNVGPCTKPSAIQPSAEERQMRAEHLKRQRELLVTKKKREREGQLSEYGQTHGNTAGVQAAEKACQETATLGAQVPDRGKQLAAELSGNAVPPASTLPDPEEAAIQMRKTIVRQLKQSLTGGVSATS